MTGANIAFIAAGAAFMLIGAAMLAIALRRRNTDPKSHTAFLISGMMVFAFGLILAGFAIAYATAEPYDLGEGAPA